MVEVFLTDPLILDQAVFDMWLGGHTGKQSIFESKSLHLKQVHTETLLEASHKISNPTLPIQAAESIHAHTYS
jgi:hypothetical protein